MTRKQRKDLPEGFHVDRSGADVIYRIDPETTPVARLDADAVMEEWRQRCEEKSRRITKIRRQFTGGDTEADQQLILDSWEANRKNVRP